MKKEDEVYFSAKMHELADKFNAVAEALETATPAVLTTTHGNFRSFADKTTAEFKKAGYNDHDWNDLMIRSGASQKMGMR